MPPSASLSSPLVGHKQRRSLDMGIVAVVWVVDSELRQVRAVWWASAKRRTSMLLFGAAGFEVRGKRRSPMASACVVVVASKQPPPTPAGQAVAVEEGEEVQHLLPVGQVRV